MDLLSDEWESFMNDGDYVMKANNFTNTNIIKNVDKMPTPSDIYISTKTKISYLNKYIDLDKLFWLVPVVKFYCTKNGIIKKQYKFISTTKEQVKEIENKYEEINNRDDYNNINHSYTVMKEIDNDKQEYKHIVKIGYGLSNKQLTSYRSKEKGVFYNSFTMVLRIYDDRLSKFREVNVKLFNTGKVQIPGVKEDYMLYKTLDYITNMCNVLLNEEYYYLKDTIETELINSNFNCGFYINQEILLNILKKKYNLISMFDSCSYPGIQSKFYYNECKEVQDGICNCERKCSKKSYKSGNGKCIEISFMIFRTGSVMIVGKCKNDDMLNIIYEFIKNILVSNYLEINEGNIEEPIVKHKNKLKRRIIKVTA